MGVSANHRIAPERSRAIWSRADGDTTLPDSVFSRKITWVWLKIQELGQTAGLVFGSIYRLAFQEALQKRD